MGARLPPVDRPRRGGIKCEFCGRTLPTVQALSTHQSALHAQALKDKTKLKPGLKLAPKISKLKSTDNIIVLRGTNKDTPKQYPGKSKVASNRSTIETQMSATNKVQTRKSISETETSKSLKERLRTKSKSTTTTNKTEFRCPKCEKVFPVLFSAQRHIQKYHSQDEQSSSEIQPIVIELCIYCDEKFSLPHNCPKRPQPGFGLNYECIGCQQQFSSTKLFDVHIGDIHGDNSESMFFPSDREFNTWKNRMQSQTECTYLLMGNHNERQVYRCSTLPDNTDNGTAQLCPSTIVRLQYPKGHQVHFYPKHYEHDHKGYTLTDQYKSYSISDLIQQAGGNASTMSSDDNDLYIQFKTLMESIVLDAAKINIDTLKILIAKAIDMTSVLTQYDEEEEVVPKGNVSNLILAPKRKVDGNKALEASKKEEIEDNGLPTKRPRKDNLKKFSLANDKDDEEILKELDSTGNKTKPDTSKTKPKPNTTGNKAKPNTAGNKAKPITTIKEAKPNTTTKQLKPSVKWSNPISSSGDEVENSIVFAEKRPIQSPSFNDLYKEFVDKTIKTNTTKASAPGKKRNVVKTKIGQFKPSLSPKTRTSLNKSDIEYEVKERDNDCNILILKV